VDRPKAMSAIRDLLVALDFDPTEEGFRETPRRVADMFIVQCNGESTSLYTTFQEIKFDELVLLKDIPISSFCQHHLLPWFGKAHVAYIPYKKLLGISKLARLVASCSRGFTIQEGVTSCVANMLYDGMDLEPKGVMVVINAVHTCMTLRGVRAVGANTITSAVRGVHRDVPAARQEVLSLIGDCK